MDILKIGGRRWRVDRVFWGSPGRGSTIQMGGYFVGARGRPTPETVNKRTANVANVSALYALLQRAEPVYVGEADKLGQRLHQHLSDDLAGLWDEFTWVSPDAYSVDATTGRGEITLWNPSLAINVTAKDIVALMELVAINFSKQGLNSQRPTLNVKWLIQAQSAKATPTIEERINTIEQRIVAVHEGLKAKGQI